MDYIIRVDAAKSGFSPVISLVSKEDDKVVQKYNDCSEQKATEAILTEFQGNRFKGDRLLSKLGVQMHPPVSEGHAGR